MLGRGNIVILAVLLLHSGCATLFANDKQAVLVDSYPRGAMVYTDGADQGGQTPRWVEIDKDEDVMIRVVHADLVYTCNYSTHPGAKWQLLDSLLILPLLIDVFLNEGGELERDDDWFSPLTSSHRPDSRRSPTWDNPGASENRCFADFAQAQAGGEPSPQAIEIPALQDVREALAQLGAVLDRRSRTNVLADARQGLWLGLMVHAGILSPTGLAGGGLELGYQRFSVELGFGADLRAFLVKEGSEAASRIGPDTSALFRARALSTGETWFGLGAGVAKSGAPAALLVDGAYDDPLWLTAELFTEQPFARLCALRLSLGGKHVLDYESCEGAACSTQHTEVYFDVALGFLL